MPRDPSDVLTRARAARAEGRFEEALEHYEYFFDHALDGDAHRYHGVRLSYCLGEWALLGEQYPLAQRRLEDRAETSRQEFERTRSRETFRDWVAINRYLGREDASVEAFVEYHSSDRPFAASIIRYLWDVLVEREHWTLRAAYLPAPL